MHSHGHDGWLLRKNAVTFRTVLSASFSLLLLSSAFWPRRHADFGAINEAFHLNAGVEFPKKTRRLYTMDYASLVSPRPGDFPGVMKCRSEVRDKHVREIQQKRESRSGCFVGYTEVIQSGARGSDRSASVGHDHGLTGFTEVQCSKHYFADTEHPAPHNILRRMLAQKP